MLSVLAGLAGASSMVLPPVDRSLAVPAAVGRYPWRVPRPLRVFHQAGGPEVSGQLISPFAEPSGFLSLSADLLVDDAYITLSSAEPAWFHDLVPVWPSQGQQCITFVPVPPCPELVCVLLVSTEWQQAVLIPSRADLGWVSGHIRRAHRGSVIAIRGPVQAVRTERSLNDAVDWRNGDVLLAWEWHASEAAMDHPVLPTVEMARHAALWMADFELSNPISVVLWRPGHRPLITTLPLPIRWSAAACTFVGQFARRYPGCWVPGPWAPWPPPSTPPRPDSVHLCLRALDEAQCNVILESCTSHETYDQLDGRCFTVHQASSRESLKRAFALPTDDIRLLGVANQEAPFPPLRDGDIIHYTVSPASASRQAHLVWPLLCLAPRFRFCSVIVLLASMSAAVSLTQNPPAESRHWLWSPFQGKLGPVLATAGQEAVPRLLQHEPIWQHGLVRTVHCLERADVHWVPALPLTGFVVVLVLGSPRPLALILPEVVTRNFLLKVLRRVFDQVQSVAGRHVGLCASAQACSELALRPGDVLDVRTSDWVPTLLPVRPHHFASAQDARVYGFWSHPLSFDGGGFAVLWSPDAGVVSCLVMRGRQTWDPIKGSLTPAFHDVIDSWWPAPLPVYDRQAILYFVPREVAAHRESQGCSCTSATPVLWQDEAAQHTAAEGASRNFSQRRSRPVLPFFPFRAVPVLLAGLPRSLGLCCGAI